MASSKQVKITKLFEESGAFLYNSQAVCVLVLNEDGTIVDYNMGFKKTFFPQNAERLQLEHFFVEEGSNSINLDHFYGKTRINLQYTKEDSIIYTFEISKLENCYILMSDIHKTSDLNVVEKMSKITNELASMTRSLNQKNDQLKRAKNELEEKDQILISQSRYSAMSELLLMLSHQWRQPLTTISLQNQVLKKLYRKKQLSEESFHDSTGLIETTINQLTKSIKLFSSKINRDKNEIISLETFFDDIQVLMHELFDNYDIEFTTEIAAKHEIKTRYSMLLQLCLIVIQNSLDAFERIKIDTPSIQVQAINENGYSIIRFKDNGGGVDNELIKTLFEPYSSTKTQKNGVGLGLFNAKLIVTKYLQGSIVLENCDLGTCTTIKFPNEITSGDMNGE